MQSGGGVLTGIVADPRSRTRLIGLAAMVDTEKLMISANEHQDLLELLLVRCLLGCLAVLVPCQNPKG